MSNYQQCCSLLVPLQIKCRFVKWSALSQSHDSIYGSICVSLSLLSDSHISYYGNISLNQRNPCSVSLPGLGELLSIDLEKALQKLRTALYCIKNHRLVIIYTQ